MTNIFVDMDGAVNDRLVDVPLDNPLDLKEQSSKQQQKEQSSNQQQKEQSSNQQQKEQSSKQQHDLEKLQEAHDRLMHEIEEKRNFAEKLHLQLDRSLEINDEIRSTLAEKEDDVRSLEAKLAEKEDDVRSLETKLAEKEDDVRSLETKLAEKDAIIAKHRENETQIPKLKALAVKLKKELAEVREELDRKSVCSTPTKEPSKQAAAEIERLSNLYQNSSKNFQALQSEYDRLQDEYDQVVEKRKRSESDLNQTITELNKLRVSAAETKHENENLKRRICDLESEAEVNFTKRKELESKIIVLQNELKEERKKLINQAGLEKTLAELRRQIDLKTSEVVDLSDLLERKKEVEEENIRLKATLNEMEEKLKKLESENEETKEQNWNLSRKLESINSVTEQERIRLVELVTEKKRIEKELESSRDSFRRKRTELEKKLKDCQKELEESREELDGKSSEFENYKSKVFKVLNEKESNHLEVHELKIKNQDLEEKVRMCESRIESLVREIDSVKSSNADLASNLVRCESEKNSIQEEMRIKLEESQRENSSLKSLCRDIQSQLVSVRSELEEKTKSHHGHSEVEKETESHHGHSEVEKETESHHGPSEVENLRKEKTESHHGHSEVENLRRKLEECEAEKRRLELGLRTRLENRVQKPETSVESRVHSVENRVHSVENRFHSVESRVHSVESRFIQKPETSLECDPDSGSTTLTPDRGLHGSPKSTDDVDSIGSTSLSSRSKRLSLSSASDPAFGGSNNVLEELMNLRFEEDENSSEQGERRVGENEETNLGRFRELLEESEAANVLLTEQNRVLKEEIRRLERAMSRIELAQNLEYLKNVLVKFVSLENGSSEKRQLVSVLKTILKLNEEEESILVQNAARSADPSAQGSNTWTSYIWS